jgi:hypothetical protein
VDDGNCTIAQAVSGTAKSGVQGSVTTGNASVQMVAFDRDRRRRDDDDPEALPVVERE